MNEKPDYTPEPITEEELDRRALRLLEILAQAHEQSRPTQARMLADAADERVLRRASEILAQSPRYWFDHAAELKERLVTSDDPEERVVQEAQFDKSMRDVWNDYDSE